ncbi:MAG: hypothetical protein ABSB29_09855 [Nitrososphaerales archaeon]|jgi:hypothetical protein
MSGLNLISREAEVLKTLRAIHQMREKFTLVGGYAVNAYSTLPRYSVDCDIVVANPQLEKFLSFFKSRDYTEKGTIYRNEIEGIATRKLVKGPGEEQVSVDLLVDGVRCRQTGAVWKEEEVSKTSKELRVTSVNGSALSSVASRELLIAMKLHSGRDTDLRDVVMLTRDANWERVRELCHRGSTEKLISQLRRDVETLGERQFEDQLKSAFASKQNESQRIGRALMEVSKLLNELQKRKSGVHHKR